MRSGLRVRSHQRYRLVVRERAANFSSSRVQLPLVQGSESAVHLHISLGSIFWRCRGGSRWLRGSRLRFVFVPFLWALSRGGRINLMIREVGDAHLSHLRARLKILYGHLGLKLRFAFSIEVHLGHGTGIA